MLLSAGSPAPPALPFGILGGVGAVSVIVAFRWLALRWTRTLAMPDAGPPVVTWTGGMRVKMMTGSIGTTRLELFDWGIRVRGLGPWRWIMPVWEARYEELDTAQRVKRGATNPGVLFRTGDLAVPIVFITFRGDQVLDHLEAFGVPVDRSVIRLGRGPV